MIRRQPRSTHCISSAASDVYKIHFESLLVVKKVFERFGTKFPLLIKFIDAAEALSVQLHPNDKIAKEKHNSFGKTEMWYILQADQDAEVIMGFKNEITKAEYQELVETNKLVDA